LALSTVSLRVDVVDNATPQLTKIATGLGTFQQKATSVLTSSGQLAGAGQGFSGALAGFNTQLNTVGTSAQTLGQRLGTLGSAIAQQGTSFGVASASVIGVASSFLSLEKASVRAEASQVRVRTLTTTLAAQTEKLRIAREKGNLTDGQMAVLESRIADTQDKLGVAQERATVMQNDYNETLSSFVTQLGPQVIAAGGSIAQIFAKDPQGISGFTRLKTAISGLISPMSGFGSGATKVTSALSGLSINLEGAGSKATGFGSALSGIGSKLSGLSGIIVPVASALVAGVGVWLLYQHTMEQVANFKKDFAVIDSLNTVDARVKQTKKAFDDLKDEDPFSQESLKKTAKNPTPENVAPLLDPFAGISNTIIKGKNLAVGAVEDYFVAKEKDGSVTAVVTDKQNKYNAAVAEYKKTLGGLHGTNQQTAFDKMVHAKADLDAAKAVAANAKGTDVYTKALAQSVGPQDAFTRGALGLGNQLVSNIAIEDQLFTAREKGMALNEEDSKNYAEASQKKQAADKLFALGQITARESTTLTREELLLLDQAYTGTAATSAVAIEKLSTTTIGLRGSIGQAVSAFLDAKIAAVDYTQALTDVDLENRLVQQGTLSGLQAAEQFFQGLVKGTAQEAVFNASLAEGAYDLGLHSEMLAFSSGKMQELLKQTYLMNKGFNDQAIAAATDTSFINDLTLKQAVLEAGMITGAQAANDWAISMIGSVQASKDEHGQLLQLTADLLGIPVPLSLTSDQLKEVMTNFQETGDAGMSLVNVITENLIPAFDLVTKLLDAKSFKEFGKNLKELALPKGFLKAGKDLDDAMKPMFNASKNAEKAGNAIKLLTTIPFDDKTFSKKLDTVKKSLENLTKVPGTTPAIDNILSQAEKMGRADFIKHAGSLNMIFDAIKQYGFLPDDIASKAIKLFNEENQKIEPSGKQAEKQLMDTIDVMKNGVPIIDKFGNTVGQIGDITKAMAEQVAKAKKPLQDFVANFSIGGQSLKDSKVPTKGGFTGKLASDPDMKKKLDELMKLGGEDKGKDIDTTAGQVAAQKLQTALANLATQGKNSLNILAQASSSAMNGLKANLGVGAAASSSAMNGLKANLAVGGTALTALAKVSSTAMNGLKNNLAAGASGSSSAMNGLKANLAVGEKALDSIASVSSSAMNGLKNNLNVGASASSSAMNGVKNNLKVGETALNSIASASSKNMNGFKNNLKVGETSSQSLAKAIATLASQGSSSLQKLASASSSAMNGFKNNLKTGETAVKNLQSAINSLKDKTVTVHVKVDNPTGAKFAKGGLTYAARATQATFGEAGPEIAAFFPLRNSGQPRKGDYDIVVPTPQIDTSGIRNAIRNNIGSQVSRNVSSSVHVHLNSPIYLFPGGPQLGKLIRQYVFDEVSKYAQV
jgi:hypothetical protein